MKKTSGIILIVLGISLMAFSALRTFMVLNDFFGSSANAYGVGYLIGTAFAVTLLLLIGWKALEKGKSLLSEVAGLPDEK